MRGFCWRCRRRVGGFLRPSAWWCATCKRLYCGVCSKERVGWLFKKPVCPQCRVELKES